MTDTGERVTSDSPLFVRQATARRYALAAGFCSGDDVLDLGCGAMMGLRPYIAEASYLGIDVVDSPDRSSSYIQVDVFTALEVYRADTVVALEVVEHLEPGRQALFIAKALAAARERLIISTPDPDANRWYPNTDHFFGKNNPYHRRELSEWRLRQYDESSAKNKDIPEWNAARHNEQDEAVWEGALGPSAWYMMIVTK